MIVTNKIYLDALKEIFNLGICAGADVLNQVMNSHISIRVPHVYEYPPENLLRIFNFYRGNKLSIVRIQFDGKYQGAAMMLTPDYNLPVMAFEYLKDIRNKDVVLQHKVDAYLEISNIILSSVVGTLSNLGKMHLKYHVPEYHEQELDHQMLEEFNLENSRLMAGSLFVIDYLGSEAHVLLFFSKNSVPHLKETLESYSRSMGIELVE